MIDIKLLYKNRFDRDKSGEWRVLCRFLQRYIPKDSVVLDIGAGSCEFINNIKAKKKYAVDINITNPCKNVKTFGSTAPIPNKSIDVVFMSNFLEHLKSKEEVVDMLKESKRVLKKNGSIIILGPNIRYAYKEYWDFIDHNIPLSDKSVAESLTALGLTIKQIIPKFLPYTTKSNLPKADWIVRLYLVMPFLWKIFGKQFLIIAKINPKGLQ